MTERERFEKWLASGSKLDGHIDLFQKMPNGDYFHQMVFAGWRAENAARGDAIVPTPPLK